MSTNLCSSDGCGAKVDSRTGHGLCSSHRPCNYNSLYDPANCNSCIALWDNVLNNSELAPVSINMLKILLKKMRASSSFNRKVVFKDIEFKNKYWDAFNTPKSLSILSDSDSIVNDRDSSAQTLPSLQTQPPPPSSSLPGPSVEKPISSDSRPALEPDAFFAALSATLDQRLVAFESSLRLQVASAVKEIKAAAPSPLPSPGNSAPLDLSSHSQPFRLPQGTASGSAFAPPGNPAKNGSFAQRAPTAQTPASTVPSQPSSGPADMPGSYSPISAHEDDLPDLSNSVILDFLDSENSRHQEGPQEAQDPTLGPHPIPTASLPSPVTTTTPPEALNPTHSTGVSPANLLYSLNTLLLNTKVDVVGKRLPEGFFTDSVSKHDLCCHPGSCPSLNALKTRGKRARDNILSGVEDTWIPLSMFSISGDNTVNFTDPAMSVNLKDLFICVSRMALFKSSGHLPPAESSLSCNISDHDIQDAFRSFATRNLNGFLETSPDHTTALGRTWEKRCYGPSRHPITDSVWSLVSKFASSCARDCADKIQPSKASLLPLGLSGFPFKFFNQERVEAKAAKLQLTSGLNELSSKSITDDFEARKAVMSSLSGFLGLDTLISVENDANRNEFLRAIARWHLPGLFTLVKTCVRARKSLRKEAFASSARNKPYVMELIEEDFFPRLSSPSLL